MEGEEWIDRQLSEGIFIDGRPLSDLWLNTCGSTQESSVDCDRCTEQQRRIILEDDARAAQMLKCIYDRMGAGLDNETLGMDANYQFERIFGIRSEKRMRFIRTIFSYIFAMSDDTDYDVESGQTTMCNGAIAAWTTPTIVGSVTLRGSTYFDQSPLGRSETMIHEWMHLYFLRADIAYSSDLENLEPWLAYLNADSYSEYVRRVCGS